MNEYQSSVAKLMGAKHKNKNKKCKKNKSDPLQCEKLKKKKNDGLRSGVAQPPLPAAYHVLIANNKKRN